MMWFWRMLGWKCYQVGSNRLWIRGTTHPEWEQEIIDLVASNRYGNATFIYDYQPGELP